jgi:transcriptional regulator with XRE-family HTH domain
MSESGRRGRPPRPVDPASAAALFADDMRKLLAATGKTYQQLAHEAGYSKSTLSRALSGQQVPTWEVVERFLAAVGVVGQAEVGEWKKRWSNIDEPAAQVPADVRFEPGAPIFYLGYAHARRPDAAGPGPSSALVQQLRDDVAEHVGELLALPYGQTVGFLDLRPRAGESWNEQIRHAIGTCHVYVPLISPRYLASPWSRYEWDAFAARAVKSTTVAQSAIIPVSWTAVDRTTLPPAIRRIQSFTPNPAPPGVVDAYLSDGLYGIMQMRLDREYEVIVWRLAQRIVDIAAHYDVEQSIPDDTADLGPSFLPDPNQ